MSWNITIDITVYLGAQRWTLPGQKLTSEIATLYPLKGTELEG